MRTLSRLLCVVIGLFFVVGLTFAKSSSSVSVASSLNPSTYGSSVKFTATVTPSAATGTVTFKDGSTTLGTGTLSSGKATYTTSTLATGSHSITAVYGGDSNYNGSTSSVLTQTVNKASTTTAVSSSANPSTYGSSVTFTATVTPSTATGTVTFKDGSTTLGTGTLSSGRATYTTLTLATGSHSITAVYGGDSNYNGSTSSVLTQTVNKASTTTAVSSSANPSTYGSSVTFTATVTPSTATGTVTFKDGSTTLGTGTLSNGRATYATSTLSGGSHSITASYGGDSNYNGSTSSTLTQTVNKANTTTTVASSANPSSYGSSVTFTATVSPSTGTGTVTFKDGNTTLGTGTISSGTASYSTSTLAVGSHSIKATYSGDSNYNTSASSILTQTVEQASSVALTSPANPAPYGSALTLTASVSPSAATGTVTFYDGGTALGSGTLASGIATYSTSSLAIGSHTITAVYGGNSTYAGSTSPALVQNVLAVSSIAVTPQNFSLAVGATQQFVATATYSDSSQGNITSIASWSSSDLTIVTVSTTGVATGVADGTALIQAAVGSVSGSASVTGAPSRFRLTGSLNMPRSDFTATLFQNGQVLIAGGWDWNLGAPTATAELYNPITGTFAYTGRLNAARDWHTATLLQNGMVLITGGNSVGSDGYLFSQTAAELYDPTTGTFSYTGSFNLGRANHTATLLQNGQVLVVGGWDSTVGSPTATAELYDPVAGTFAYTGSLSTPTWNQSATLLNDGTVLVAGGDSNWGQSPIAAAQLYNPTTAAFTPTGNLIAAREYHTATLLSTGKVLIAGGADTHSGDSQAQYLAAAELYDPVAKIFSSTGSLAYARGYATATLLNNGQVLIAGGDGTSSTGFMGLGPAEIYDPTAATFSVVGNLNLARAEHCTALLNDGTVLIAGGGGGRYYFEDGYSVEAVPQAEIYQTPGSQIQPPDSLQITPATANVMVGGTQYFTAVDSNGYPRQDVTWTVSDPSLASVTSDEDDAGVLTGIAVGQVTLTANAENVTGQAQVTISAGSGYAPGTVLWSVPPTPGFSAQQIVQAVPSSGGPDLYSVQLSNDGTRSIVQALTADGRQLWQTTLPALNNNSVPDGGGGLLVEEYDTCTPGQTNPLTVFDLDPMYGRPQIVGLAAGVQEGNHVVYCYGGGDAPQIAIRGDGAVIMSEPTNNGFPQLSMVLPNNGAQTIYDLEPPSTITTLQGQIVAVQCCVGPPMVNTDGTVYVEWESRQMGQTRINSDTLYWFQINPDNSIGGGILSSTTQNQALLPGSIVPDGQGGVLAAWTISPASGPVPQYPYQAVDVSGGVIGTPYNLPFSPQTIGHGQTPTIVLGENGTGFAAGNSTSTDGLNNAVSQIVSFSLASGAANWTYQGAVGDTLSIIQATADGGVTVNDSNTGVFQLGATGSPALKHAPHTTSSRTHIESSASYYLQGAVPLDLSTWLSTASGAVTALWSPNGTNGIPTVLAQSVSPMPHGNAQGQSLPLFCQRKNVSCALAPESDGPDPILQDVPNRQVVYWLFNLQNGTLSPLEGPSVTPPPVKIEEWEANASNGASICNWQNPANECESPNAVNKDTPGQLTDHMDAALGGPFTVQQQFLVDRQGVQVFWPNSNGSWYGAWGTLPPPQASFHPNQTANVTIDWATISQINANTNAPTACASDCDTMLPQAGRPKQ